MKNKLKPTVTEQLSARRRFRTVLVGGSLAVVALVALFYAEEDWRGRLAWARAKRELSARGGVLVRAAPLPTKIPDELNVLKAPRMSEWFLSHEPTDLMTRLNGGNSWTHPERQRLVDITFVSLTNDPSTFPGLCLDYNAPMLAPADPHWKGAPPSSSSVVFPLIVMEDVPLPDAIKNLARQAQRNHSFDSNLTWQFTRSSLDPSATPPSTTPRNSRTPPPPVLVNVRWQNVTAFQALMVLLANHNLAWTEDFTNHVGLISMRSADTPLVQVLTSAREQLRQSLAFLSSPPNARTLKSASGFILFHNNNSMDDADPEPVRLTIRAANVPSVAEVQAFFPRSVLPWLSASFGLRARPSETNRFSLFTVPECFCSAADYLAQTDCCKSDFDLIREALKRPSVSIDDNSELSLSSPPRNFVTVRVLSQTLAARAQAYLLLHQPDLALKELTLIHDLTRVIETEPYGLVSAMVEVAVTGLYLQVIHDGLRLGEWTDPQLAALQAQLDAINLGSLFVSALSTERTALCRALETAGPEEFVRIFDLSPMPVSMLEKLKRSGFAILAFGPRGWRYRSMSASAELQQRFIDCFDPVTRTVQARKLDAADSAAEILRRQPPLPLRLAAIATPSFKRSWQAMAHAQSFVHQAFIACALQRYRLAHREYPEGLASLSPTFARQIPRDIISGGNIQYRRIDAARFALYADGWNGNDDGNFQPDNDSITDYTKAHWVWN